MDPFDPFAASNATPTAERPLLGLTVLVVEDSRYACEAIRLLCVKSGARIRRADCLRSARRHLRVYRPTVVLIDLGLPDGDGLDLISELRDSQPAVEVLLATSGQVHLASAARTAGAHGFLAKPITSIAQFQEAILALLPASRRPSGPRLMTDEKITPDQIAYHDDMAHIAEILSDLPDDTTVDYATQFIEGVAVAARDKSLQEAAQSLARRRSKGQTTSTEIAHLAGMVQSRLSQRVAI